MKYKTNRDEELIEVRQLFVYINDAQYTLTPSTDGKLCINKVGESLGEEMNIHPNYANQISIS